MSSPLTGLSSMATRRLLDELAPAYRERTGTEVAIRSMGGVDALKLARAGEPTDIVVLAADVIAALEADGHLLAGSRRDLVRSGIAAAVKVGVARPPIGSEDALKEAVLTAGRIGYSTGPSGTHLLALFDRWGIGAAIADRLVQAQPGHPVGELLARGEVDLGFQQTSELLGLPGIEILGPLPEGAQSITTFSAGVARVSERAGEAEALIAYLASAETAEAKRRCGMEPV